MRVKGFFEYVQERYMIKLRRDCGERPPLTGNPVLQAWRFCNVFREDDRTTVWFRENLRDPLRREADKVALVTAAFRTFNRVETGERIKDILLTRGWDERAVKRRLRGVRPIITGAYRVVTPLGLSKLDGACRVVKFLRPVLPKLKFCSTLEEAHALLTAVRYQGHFTAYEIVTDLRHTCVLEGATDVMTWANPGPGAARGLQYLTGFHLPRTKANVVEMVNLMCGLLDESRHNRSWPSDWPRWEMREVEHNLCEFSKYRDALAGRQLKRRYRYAG